MCRPGRTEDTCSGHGTCREIPPPAHCHCSNGWTGDDCSKVMERKKWSYATGDAVGSSPTVSSDGSVLYIGSYDKNVYAINTTDGSKKWSYATGGEVHSSPTLSSDGSVLYIGSLDKNV